MPPLGTDLTLLRVGRGWGREGGEGAEISGGGDVGGEGLEGGGFRGGV